MNWGCLVKGAVAKLLSPHPRDAATRSSVSLCWFNQLWVTWEPAPSPPPVLRLAPAPTCMAKSVVTQPTWMPTGAVSQCPMSCWACLRLLGVIQPSLSLSSSSSSSSALASSSELCCSLAVSVLTGVAGGFWGGEAKSGTAHAALPVGTGAAGQGTGGSGSHQQLLQLLLDAGQRHSPVQERAELIALRGDGAAIGAGLTLALPWGPVLLGDTGQGFQCCPWASVSLSLGCVSLSLTLAGRWKPATCSGASGCRGVELSCTWGGSRGLEGLPGGRGPIPGVAPTLSWGSQRRRPGPSVSLCSWQVRASTCRSAAERLG